jgi:hypothetical protein
MRRRMFNIAAAASLVLCAAAAALWVCGSFKWFQTEYTANNYGLEASSWPGTFRLVFSRTTRASWEELGGYFKSSPATTVVDVDPSNWPNTIKYFRFLGFKYYAYSYPPPLRPGGAKPNRWTTIDVEIPLWFVMYLSALFPIRWLELRIRRKSRPGLCRCCGYNLTGNTSGVCPECGSPIPQTATPASSSAESSGEPAR